MYSIDRSLRFIRGALLVYGPSAVKKLFWDREYANGKWDFIDDTAGDCVYSYLERYAKGGSILDLGCGPGNTANELPTAAYRTYLGVDISTPCLEKATKRSKEVGRAHKNSFVRADFLCYTPPGTFDVILLRESLYHVPMHKIPNLLRHYAHYLTAEGVFILRLYIVNKGKILSRPRKMVSIVKWTFPLAEYQEHSRPGSTAAILVVRPQPGLVVPRGA